MIRHTANFALAFAFGTLAVTGVLAFLRPFSLTTTRVHVLAGVITVALVLEHIVRRLPYFKRQLAARKPNSRRRLLGLAAGWGALLAATLFALPPTTTLMDLGYEARHRADIVRTSSLTGFGEPAPHRKLIVRAPGNAGTNTTQTAQTSGLSLYASFPKTLPELPAIAVWAESSTGSLIETLYLPESLSFADKVQWEASLTRRSHILPIWRNRYTLLSGLGPDGEVDAVSGATDTHSFALDPYLAPGSGDTFVLCVEVNAPADPNHAFPEGQPSLLYTAVIDPDAESPYTMLELTAHGGDAESNGNLSYDLDGFTTAKTLVDLLLAKLESPK